MDLHRDHGDIQLHRSKIDSLIDPAHPDDDLIAYEGLLASLQQSGGVWDIKRPDDEKSTASTTVSRLMGNYCGKSQRNSQNF